MSPATATVPGGWENVSWPEFCGKRRWRPNDLVFRDNRALMHRAKGCDMARHPRVFRDTTVADSGPIPGPCSQAVGGKVRPLTAR